MNEEGKSRMCSENNIEYWSRGLALFHVAAIKFSCDVMSTNHNTFTNVLPCFLYWKKETSEIKIHMCSSHTPALRREALQPNSLSFPCIKSSGKHCLSNAFLLSKQSKTIPQSYCGILPWLQETWSQDKLTLTITSTNHHNNQLNVF